MTEEEKTKILDYLLERIILNSDGSLSLPMWELTTQEKLNTLNDLYDLLYSSTYLR